MIWGIDGGFHSVSRDPRRIRKLAAAANWLALAMLAARLIPESRGILIDIGTTTADLIPLDAGEVASPGAKRYGADPDRRACLRRRSPHPHLRAGDRASIAGIPTGLAAEIFASTLDVYLILGDIEPEPDNLSTADGRPATVARSKGPAGPDGRRRPRQLFGSGCNRILLGPPTDCLTARLCRAAERLHGDDRPARRRGHLGLG